MDKGLKTFLCGRSPLVEEEQNWQAGASALLQTRATYTLLPSDSPPLRLVTSVRALLTRGGRIMVVRDPEGEHIIPGGRVDAGEGLLEALERELLEETGWSVRGEPVLIGLFHYHIHSPEPSGYRYPYPDFLQLVYRAEAGGHFPDAVEASGYELGAGFRALNDVQRLALSQGEMALLQLLQEF
ncbi:MAG: NUDIX domain-containing protein [Caldilineaceae bacterium]|nr:NUDIX domain-containing protein [Caldilineaceae bacterium]